MRILFAGGGTAGHINPALAIAGFIRNKNKDAEILFVGNRGGMEETLVPKAGFDMEFIHISGFQRKLTPAAMKQNALTVKRTFTSSREAKKIIEKFKPDICVDTGGYVSGPVLRTAAKMGIPTIIHEQNAYPGVTNKMLAKNAKKVMLAVKDAEKYFDKNSKCVPTGNPVRREIIEADKEPIEKGIELYLHIMRAQPYIDGNKRTANVFANLYLLQNDCPIISVHADKRKIFLSQLSRFYETNNPTKIIETIKKYGLYDIKQ